MSSAFPIRKVAVAALAFVITYVAQRLGVDLGSDAVNDIAQGAITIGAAYVVKDPRVRDVVEEVEEFASGHPAITAEVHKLADRFVQSLEASDRAVSEAYAYAANAAVSLADARRKVHGV